MVNKYHKSARDYLVEVQYGILKKKKAKKVRTGGGRRKLTPTFDRNYTGK